jgi:soluble lytic murein transglycosylase-like protein
MFTKVLVFIFAMFILPVNASTPQDDFVETLIMSRMIADWIHQEYPKSASLPEAQNMAEVIMYQASLQDVRPSFMLGVFAVESEFKARALSKSGAKGITQVMPKYHKKKIAGRSLFDPRVSIEVGTNILRECLDKVNDNHRTALSCYSGYKGKAARRYQIDVIDRIKNFTRYSKSNKGKWNDWLLSSL